MWKAMTIMPRLAVQRTAAGNVFIIEESVANDANDALRDGPGRLDGHHAESALPAVLVTADGRLVRQAAQH